jgi:hypothetical protein
LRSSIRPEKGCFIRLNAKEENEDTLDEGRYLSIKDHVPEGCILKFVSPFQRIEEADFFYKYKKKEC